MRDKPYKLEILWSNGVLTEISITEKEKDLIEKYMELFIVPNTSLKESPVLDQ